MSEEMIASIRYRAATEKRALFVELLGKGATIETALAQVGWARSSYLKARQAHPDFKAKADAARAVAARRSQYEGEPGTFDGFVRKYFPDRLPHKAHQLRIVAELQSLRPREIVLINMWPEAGKTATLEDWMGRKFAYDRDHRIRVVSEAADLSKRIVGTVKRRMTDKHYFGDYIKRFGPFYDDNQERNGKAWSNDHIMFCTNPGIERDYNLVATSWTAATYGSRIDTLILDDVQSQRNYNQAEEIARRIQGTFFNRGIEMRTLIVGTRIGPGDVYERFRDKGLVTKEVTLPAADHNGDPHVPEWWDRPNVIHDGGPCCKGFRQCPRNGHSLTPREFMELIRHQSGEETWWASYMQRPQALELSTFAPYLDKCLDHDRRYGSIAA